ncbi:MAG: hypothetical protein RL414_1258 [Actinomycetota bacterium]|jgi:DNA polymerase III epsilon subunit family exonuclease
MNAHLSETTFVVVDLETTGGSPTACEITEIGAVKVRGGEVIGNFKTFINPLQAIPEFITELTGITDEMVKDSPIIDDVLPDFFHWCGSWDETVLVAHNAPFDISFLKAAAEKIDHEWPDYSIVDTVRFARKAIDRDDVTNYRLGTLAEFFNTAVLPTHRALDDAQTTVEILHRLIERVGNQGITHFDDLVNFLAPKRALTQRET